VSRVHCLNVGATLSHGKITGDVPAISVGAERLAEGITSSLFAQDYADHYQRLRRSSVKLTRSLSEVGAPELAALRQIGLTDLEILDLTNAVAMFAWANRLMQTLGDPVVGGLTQAGRRRVPWTGKSRPKNRMAEEPVWCEPVSKPGVPLL
jgi:hypothetical protein